MSATYRAAEVDIEIYSGNPVVDCEFEFLYEDTDGTQTDYDFSAQDGLYLKIYDRRGGTIIKEWNQAAAGSSGLRLDGNTILWNEYDGANTEFSRGVYYYEIGYFLDDYTPDDIEILMGYGKATVI